MRSDVTSSLRWEVSEKGIMESRTRFPEVFGQGVSRNGCRENKSGKSRVPQQYYGSCQKHKQALDPKPSTLQRPQQDDSEKP